MAEKDDIPSSLRSYIIDHGNIDVGTFIAGRGAHGRVLEATWERITVAVKEIHSIFINETRESEFQEFRRSFLRECEQSSRLRHPNIVRFFGIYNPPKAKVPSLVMEWLHCNLSNLLKENSHLPIETKLSIIYDVALGLRYLHTRNPIIIHRDLSSNNVLISRRMEAKIGDMGTARLVDPKSLSEMTRAPGTMHFMPPEVLADSGSVMRYGGELDVFSFGCVMLHTLSHQWPTPSLAVVTDPVTLEVKGCTEVERRSSYFDRIDDRVSILNPVIKSCLINIPKNRASIAEVCRKLEGLVDKQRSTDDETNIQSPSLQQKLKQQDDEIRKRDDEIYKLQAHIQRKENQIKDQSNEICAMKEMLPKQVSKSSTDFWNGLHLAWEKCVDLPVRCSITSVAELDGKVYIAIISHTTADGCFSPLIYHSHKEKWYELPKLPCEWFSLVVVACKKQLLAIGGKISNGVSNKVFAWDEDEKKWISPYPDMPTARYHSSCVSHGSSVIVAGGATHHIPLRLTGAVEVLHIIEHGTAYWNVVEPLPHVVCEAMPLMINDELYIATGYDNDGHSTCNIVTASIPELLKSSDKKVSYVWHKLPDMPHSSWSIIHYQNRLIILNGDHLIEQLGRRKSVWKLVRQSYLYNPRTKSWDYLGNDFHDYKLGKSVYLGKNKVFFIGGETNTFNLGDGDVVKTCSILTLTQN